MVGFGPGTYPFDDYVSTNLIPLPTWVMLHYELTQPGVIEYDLQFDYKILLPLLVYGLVRIGQMAYQAFTSIELGGRAVP
jgi:hypothetical protein